MTDLRESRMALISVLANLSPQKCLGRTAVMKLLYFLQTVRNVPLGYRFTLYSYGPFDSDVLADLENAETLGVVDSTVVPYSGGYGYQIKVGAGARWLQNRSLRFLKKYERDVRWVVRKFGSLSTAQLELVSTVIFVDRELSENQEELSADAVAEIVKEIKPHFSIDQIVNHMDWLRDEELLEAVA